MLDIAFYMKVHDLRKELDAEKKYSKEFLEAKFEELRNKQPVIYNIETTNSCNMSCKMCPRTTLMTRPIVTIDRETFINVVDQIKPHSNELWAKWVKFVESEYGIKENDASENHFFLYIISKTIQLHGYGDPLLDKNIADYVKILSDRGFYSYFSCNPANINLEKTYEIMHSGLDYLKYSIESVDDKIHKEVRGEASNFQTSYEKILKVLEYKKTHQLKTTIVITMIDLNRTHQKEDYDKLRNAFKDLDIYLYLKSENGQWYRNNYHQNKSVHWSELCKHPWMTMTVLANGTATMCPEDYDAKVTLGNTKEESLYDIWNGEKYAKFRKDHFDVNTSIKCRCECDMKLIGNYL